MARGLPLTNVESMSDDSAAAMPVPSEPITDQDREIAVRQIQRALAEGQVDFDDLDDRFGAIYQAQTRGELEAVSADLPLPPPPVAAAAGHPMASTSVSLFGDIRKSGDLAIEGELVFVSLFGDVVLDLATARIADGSKVSVYSAFGDATVILPDGIRVRRSAVSLLGDEKESLSPPVAGAPTISVVRFGMFGDTKIYSLSRVPEGRLQKLWRSLRRS